MKSAPKLTDRFNNNGEMEQIRRDSFLDPFPFREEIPTSSNSVERVDLFAERFGVVFCRRFDLCRVGHFT
jgi:hypothetical protein